VLTTARHLIIQVQLVAVRQLRQPGIHHSTHPEDISEP
jgi:hypothetical protein